MKYLKLFEDYNDKPDKYYFEISSDEFLPKFIDNNIGTLTESELKSINDLGYNFQIKNSSFAGNFYLHNDANTTLQFFIAPEEWFYVSLQNQSPGQKYIAKYYKCDQFDGLLKFLRNYIAYSIFSNKKDRLLKESNYYSEINSDQFDLLVFGPDMQRTDITNNSFVSKYWVNLTKDELKLINDIGFNFQIKNTALRGDNQKCYYSDQYADKKISYSLMLIKLSDEWFYLGISEYFRTEGSSSDNCIQRYYKCDQIDGLLQKLKEYKNLRSEMWFSENYLTESDKLYQKLNFDQDGLSMITNNSGNLCDISLSDYHLEKIKSLFKNCQYKIVVSNNYKIANFELNSPSENKLLSFTIQEIKDGYFIIRFWMNNGIRRWGLGSYYKCDQFDGLYEFLKDYPEWSPAILKEISNNRLTLSDYKEYMFNHVDINENLYYIRDNPHEPSKIPPGSKEGEVLPNDISDSDINFIKKELGIDTKTNIIKREFIAPNPITNSPVQIVTYYIFYYNMKGEVGNLNTMSNTRNQDIRLVHVYSYTNEWFKVRIDDRLYWCDQVDAVVKCVQDSIDKDVFYNNINESINTEITDEYFYQITPGEFKNLLGISWGYAMETIKFTDKEIEYLNMLNKEDSKQTGIFNYAFDVMDNRKCITFKMTDGIFNETLGEIFKVNDEWFIVELTLDVINIPVHYKCDQIDGLIHFLKKLKKTKKK